jgi:aspartate/methionine/tyrosine aminotransferase
MRPEAIESFYSILNEKYQTYVGPGHWFGMDRRYMRIGFAWPDINELNDGLNNIHHALEQVNNH